MVAEKNNSVTLKVGELINRDEIGRGIVRVDSKVMQSLGVREGDVVELGGKRNTGAIAARSYPGDIGLNIARIDGVVRKNVGVSIGENIKIAKSDVKEAKRVVLAPAQKGIMIQMDAEPMKRTLFMRPMSKGDKIRPLPVVKQRGDDMLSNDFFSGLFGGALMGLPRDFEFTVVDTSPAGIAQVTENTEIVIKPEAVEVEEMAIPSITYEDIGGLRDSVDKIREMVELPLRHPELFTKLGIEPPKGVLLYGPPGTGKTLLAKAVANESGANFFSIAGPEIMNKFYGQSEQNLRDIFQDAQKNAPAIIFIDEIDSIAPKRGEVTGEVERRVVSQLLTLMDGLKNRGKVVVIAATNMPEILDPALRRGGRFDREVEIGVPDQKGRLEIMQIHTRNMPLAKDVDLKQLSAITYGFVGADLETLAKEAAMSALRRNLPGITWKKTEELPEGILEKLRVEDQDFRNALKMVEPSGMREVLIEIPNVKWDDIGGLAEVKQLLRESVEWPLNTPEAFTKIGIRPPKGILLYGPPGSGKTMLAKAVATESNANFISIAGPELLSKWLGESEKHVREIFRRAKQVAPAIIFFDEIDALASRRGIYSGMNVENVVSQILTAMSGLEDMHNVVVIAATNRPDMIDPALLRPGRFDRQILVPVPDLKARLHILKIHTRNMPLKTVDLKKLAKGTEGYTGADLEALVREAGMSALRKDMKAKIVTKADFAQAMKKVAPSIKPEHIKFYDSVSETFKAPKVRKKTEKEEELEKYVG